MTAPAQDVAATKPQRPKIFVFCNDMRCAETPSGEADHDWHEMVALAEDGTALAGHLCSNHNFAAHDMGVAEKGWKRDLYAAHYPDGFEVVWVPRMKCPPGELLEAFRLNAEREPADGAAGGAS